MKIPLSLGIDSRPSAKVKSRRLKFNERRILSPFSRSARSRDVRGSRVPAPWNSPPSALPAHSRKFYPDRPEGARRRAVLRTDRERRAPVASRAPQDPGTDGCSRLRGVRHDSRNRQVRARANGIPVGRGSCRTQLSFVRRPGRDLSGRIQSTSLRSRAGSTRSPGNGRFFPLGARRGASV